jgi:hypothetical protein
VEDTRQTFRDVEEEARFFRHTQLTKYTHLYSISWQVPGAALNYQPKFTEAVLQVMEDTDFHITHVCGSVGCPVNVNGIRMTDPGSAITLIFPMAGSAQRSDRGISFKFQDPKENTRHTEAQVTRNAVDLAAQGASINFTYLNFGDVFAPGYDYGFGRLVPFDYFLERGKRFKVQIQTREGGVGSAGIPYSRISMGFVGCRYDTEGTP